MTVPMIVFVDGARVQLQPGSTALDAVRARSEESASEVERGARLITDSRGLPLPSDTPVYGGAIFRVIAKRADVASDAASAGESSEAGAAEHEEAP